MIEVGMLFEEVVGIISRPMKDIGSGQYVMLWETETGEIFYVSFTTISYSHTRVDLTATYVGFRQE